MISRILLPKAFWIQAAIVMVMTLAIALVYLEQHESGGFRSFEGRLLDLRFQMRGPRSGGDEIVILEIDDASIAALGGWPLPRESLARTVDMLSADGAKVIALDLLLVDTAGRRQQGPVSGDRALATSLSRAENVILPFAFTFGAEEANHRQVPAAIAEIAYRDIREPTSDSAHADLFPSPSGLLAPARRFLRPASPAQVNVFLDPDGALRLSHLAIKFGSRYFPSLPVEALRLYLDLPPEEVALHLGQGIEIGERFVPTDASMCIPVNYYGPMGRFQHYRLSDLLDGKLQPGSFDGRIVLVGATAIGVGDAFVSPFSPRLPGVEHFATVIDNMLSGQLLNRTEATIRLDVLIILACGLASLLMLGIRTAHFSFAFGLGLVALCVVGNFLAFWLGGLWLNLTFPLITLAVCIVVLMISKTAVQTFFRPAVSDARFQYVEPEMTPAAPAAASAQLEDFEAVDPPWLEALREELAQMEPARTDSRDEQQPHSGPGSSKPILMPAEPVVPEPPVPDAIEIDFEELPQAQGMSADAAPEEAKPVRSTWLHALKGRLKRSKASKVEAKIDEPASLEPDLLDSDRAVGDGAGKENLEPKLTEPKESDAAPRDLPWLEALRKELRQIEPRESEQSEEEPQRLDPARGANDDLEPEPPKLAPAEPSEVEFRKTEAERADWSGLHTKEAQEQEPESWQLARRKEDSKQAEPEPEDLKPIGILEERPQRPEVPPLRKSHSKRPKTRYGMGILDRLSGAKQATRIRSDQDVTVVCIDLRGFTSLSEDLSPGESMTMLRRFHRAVERSMLSHYGAIDKFMGDGAVAVFGVPHKDPSASLNALRAVRQLVGEVEEMNQELARQRLPLLDIRAGLHSGPVELGPGEAGRSLRTTISGDTVNLASRLEDLTRATDATVVASDSVIESARALGGEAAVAGFAEMRKPKLRGRWSSLAVWSWPSQGSDGGRTLPTELAADRADT